MARTSANSATLLVGDTGSGKSSLLATYAEWVWERFHVQTRYYSSDGGGWGDKMEALIQLGIVQVWKIRTRDPDGTMGLTQETIIRASQGWWPKFIDPENGESPLSVQMAPPEAGWKGAVMYDGLSSLCDWALDELGVRNAYGTLGGEPTALKMLPSGELKLGSANRGGVGFVQGRVQNWINNTLAIRGLVAPPVFTALEQKTTDDDTKLLVYGPKIAGRARMTDVPSWVGNCLGTCLALDDKGKPQYRLYTMEYRYPQNDTTRHLCGNRTNQMGLLPEFLADPAGEPFTKFNLGFFFELLAKALEKTLADQKAKFKDAPGLAASTYEEAPAAAPAGPGSPFVGGPPPGPFAPSPAVALPLLPPAAAPAAPAGPAGPPPPPGPAVLAPPPAPIGAPPEARRPGRPRKTAPAEAPAGAAAPTAPAGPEPPAAPPAIPPVALGYPGNWSWISNCSSAPAVASPALPVPAGPPAVTTPAVPPAGLGPGVRTSPVGLPPAAPTLHPPQVPGPVSRVPGPPLVTVPPAQAVAPVAVGPSIRPAPPGIRPPARAPIPAAPAGSAKP